MPIEFIIPNEFTIFSVFLPYRLNGRIRSVFELTYKNYNRNGNEGKSARHLIK